MANMMVDVMFNMMANDGEYYIICVVDDRPMVNMMLHDG